MRNDITINYYKFIYLLCFLFLFSQTKMSFFPSIIINLVKKNQFKEN